VKPRLSAVLFCFSFALCVVASALGQEEASHKPKGYSAVKPLWGVDHEKVKAAIASGSSDMIPMWTFNVTSTRDGNPYSGEMVGASAFSDPNSSTSVLTQIIPVIFVMPDGGVFDPPFLTRARQLREARR
jgi:hypothetical protein